MSLSPIFGHDAVRNRLAGAVASSRLPQVLLFEGPRGVGKQRLALWLAHPAVRWFGPLELGKRGADADRQVEWVAEALAEEMATRRDQPLYDARGGLPTHSMAAVRLLLRRLAVTPAMATRKVFSVGDA